MSYRNVRTTEGSIIEFPMAADAVFEGGEIVCLDSGFAEPGKTATGLKVPGIATRAMDNTGGNDGDKVITVQIGFCPKGIRIEKVKNDSGGDAITAADIGADVYLKDEATVTKNSTGRTKCGRAMRLYSDGDVGVWFNQ